MNEQGHQTGRTPSPTATSRAYIDVHAETKYWRDNHSTRLFVPTSVFGYDEYAPAYRYGWESFGRHGAAGRTFDSIEAELGRGWDQARYGSRLAWEQAKDAAREAWDRLKSAAQALTTPTDK